VSSTWCYPVLPISNYTVWPGCEFLSDEYFKATGSVHSGTDLNIRTGGNSDLGKPIYAMSDGVVTKVETHRVWGNIIVIYHPLDRVWSQYAHAQTMLVKVGQSVGYGDQIATIGRGGQNDQGHFYFYAHLHCEIRVTDLSADNWPSTRYPVRADAERYTRATRHDPVAWLTSKGALTTLAAVQAARRQPVVVTPPRPTPKVPSNWQQLRDASNATLLPGEWISRHRNATTGEIVYFKVPAYRLAEVGL
jgi:murein DD-endopeptidase MepM/ murein hydrolase activator NlpD